MKRTVLIELRGQRGFTQEFVAEAAGIQRSYYGHIETGERNPSLKVAQSIAKVFNMPITEVFPEDVFFAGKCYEMKQNM